jgi:hypothetical protein
MKLGLILSNDWEVFGDGSGDYFEVQHKPLAEMLDVADNHGAKVTVMAEVGQQWGHRELGRTEAWAAKVADAWEEIVRETIRRKSDVQLHLHPQWIGARYNGSTWDLHLDNWSIASLPPDGIEAALRRGKEYLEEIIRPVDPDYECIAFRAGAYCIEPSSKVIPILRRLGIMCDTSVTKGLFDPQFYNYKDAHSNAIPWMTTGSSVKYAGRGDDGVLEIPIYSFPMIDSMALRVALGKARARGLFYRLNFKVPYEAADQQWMEERNRVANERYPPSRRPYSSPMSKLKKNITSPSWLASTLLSRQMVQLDYDYIPANIFVKSMRQILDRHERSEPADVIVPVMASGHVKNMHNCGNIDRILAAVNREFGDQVVHWTLREAADYWLARLGRAR